MTEPRKKGVVAEVRARLAALLALQVFLSLVTVAGLAALAAIILDAVIILPDGVRAQVVWVLAAAGAAVLAVGMARLRRLKDVCVARRMEGANPALGTALTNAVQFDRRTGASAVEEVLRQQAVAYGREKVLSVDVWPVARRGVIIGAAMATLAVAAWGVGPLAYPDVFEAVLPRFLDPWGDHPPYSRLKIEVQPMDAETLYGGQCEIHATASGMPVEKLHLVTENKEGTSESVMFRAPDASYFQTLTNLREETQYYVTDGRARSHRYRIAVQYTPRITLVEVRQEYPAYTLRPAHRQKVEKADLAVPAKTRLEFSVASNRPLKLGVLELAPILGGAARRLPLVPTEADGKVVTGGFEAEEGVAFSISVTDVEGLASGEPVKGRVILVPDRKPRILVLEPRRASLATPEIAVPIHVRAEDDYAVASVLWFRGHNQSVERSVPMNLVAKSGPASVEAMGQLDLKDLGVRPGDHLEFFFEALDNYPGGPNVATSPPHTIDIISMDEYSKLVRSLQMRQAFFQPYMGLPEELRRILERAETLEQRLRKLAGKGGTDAEKAALRAEAKGLREALAEFQKALGATLATPPEFDVEHAFHETLGSLVPELAGLMKQLDDAGAAAEVGAGGGIPDPEALASIRDALRDMAARAQANVGQPARMIAEVVRLLVRADLFAQMAQREKEIVKLAERFKEHQGVLSRVQEMELQELGAQQQRVGDAMRQLMEELPELADQLPADPTYDKLRAGVAEFVSIASNLAIQIDLDKATDLMMSLDGRAGYFRARQAAEKMEQLVEKVEATDLPGQGGMCLKFQPALMKTLGNTLAQVMAAMKSQGAGGEGGGGYGLLGQDTGLYGPDVQVTGGNGSFGDASPDRADAKAEGKAATGSDATDPRVPQAKGPVRVRLQRDAKFPLRYGNLVGEYFRAVAESQEEK
jgi:hypothetical protein